MNKNDSKSILLLILFLTILGQGAFAQTHEVKGVVKDVKGEVLIGVSVQQEGTNIGASTDFDGNYTIKMNDPKGVLVFKYLGFLDQKINVNGRNVIDVVLQEGAQQLDEVVVVGYGSVKKSDLTGSVQTLKAKSLEETPTPSIDLLLQGKLSGVRVTQTSGEPGAGVNIQIRGIGSRAGSNPLYIVDGFPFEAGGNLKQINPNDIASVEILKDASATAIYGSRGANGVVIITTKGGRKNQKPTFSFSMQNGVQIVDHDRLNLINDPLTFAILSNETRQNDTRDGVNPLFVGGPDDEGIYRPSLTEIANGTWPHRTYWPDVILRGALNQNINLSASGGNEKTAYSASVNFFRQQGVLIGNDYYSITGRTKLDKKIGEKFNFNSNIAFSYVKRDRTQSGNGIGRSPLTPVFNPDGTYYRDGSQDFFNPVMLANEITDISNEYDLNAIFTLQWDILENLNFRYRSGIKVGLSVADYYEPRTTFSGAVFNGVGQISNFLGIHLVNEAFFTYDWKLPENHKLTTMVGASTEEVQNRSSDLRGEGFVNDVLGNENLFSATNRITSNSAVREALQSYFFRFNYTYKDKYLFTVTGRNDGSSKFGTENKFAFFPSAAFAWKVTNEPFMERFENVVSDLKLRTSYGSVGNQGISPYQTEERFGLRPYGYPSPISGYGPWMVGNNALKWETTTQFDFGIDLGLFNNRVSLTADIYRKSTEDLLRNQLLPHSSGFESVWINSGSIKNNGYELAINAKILTGEFKWGVDANLSRNVIEIVDIGPEGVGADGYGLPVGSYIESFRDNPTRWRNGWPLGIIVGYRVDGIVQTEAEGLAAGLLGDEALPGEFKYVDLNKDGVVDVNDQTVIGNIQPDFIVGFTSEFSYKNFDFSAQFYGAIGNDILNIKRFEGAQSVNRWTVNNNTNKWPSLRGGRLNRISDWWIEDGSYLRIANVTLGYNLPPDTFEFIKSLRVYLTGNNLHTFTNFSGADPEIDGGVNYGSYPKYRTFTLGLNMSF